MRSLRYYLRTVVNYEGRMPAPKDIANQEVDGMFDEDGKPHSNQPSTVLLVPTPPTIEGGSLIWRVNDTGVAPHHYARPGSQLIFDFARLSESPDKVIQQFASRWGMLVADFKEDLLPIEAPVGPDMPVANALRLAPLQGWTDGVFTEPLEEWRHHSRVARALLNIATFLHNDEFGR